jgi:hypothetical protein
MPSTATARKPRVNATSSKCPRRVQQATLDATCCDPTAGMRFPRADGFVAGERWAKTMTAKQARNLLQLAKHITSDEEFCWHLEYVDDFNPMQELYLDIRGEFDRYDHLVSGQAWPDRRAEALAWWSKVLGDEVDNVKSGEFLKGFLIAALCMARTRGEIDRERQRVDHNQARRAARATPGHRKFRPNSGRAAGHGVPAAR